MVISSRNDGGINDNTVAVQDRVTGWSPLFRGNVGSRRLIPPPAVGQVEWVLMILNLE